MIDELMKRIERLEDELIKNRDFLAKTNSMCFDEKTKTDITARINSKLDLINWIREQNEEIFADTKYDNESESNTGIWDKAVLSAEICANHLANVMIMTSNLAYNQALAARRKEVCKLIDACNYFRSAMAAIDQETYKYPADSEKKNDGTNN